MLIEFTGERKGERKEQQELAMGWREESAEKEEPDSKERKERESPKMVRGVEGGREGKERKKEAKPTSRPQPSAWLTERYRRETKKPREQEGWVTAKVIQGWMWGRERRTREGDQGGGEGEGRGKVEGKWKEEKRWEM